MFIYKKDQDQIGILTLDMAGKSPNAMNSSFIKNLKPELEKIFSDSSLKGLIVTSAKKDFMAGGDLEFIYGINSVQECLEIISHLHDGLRFLETRGKPVVAAINGTALGGG